MYILSLHGCIEGDKKCWASGGGNHAFVFRPSPTQYATTMKEAMMVCSQLGADLPQYVTEKCLRKLVGGDDIVFTRDSNSWVVRSLESILASKEERAKIVCQSK